jgi:heptosyltransferase-3
MRILFVTSSRIGDAVLSTGLLDHLARIYPDARFTVACGPVAAGLFAHMPRLDRLIVFDKRRYGRHWLGLWAKTAFTRWDLVVDIRASALAWLVPTRRRAIMRKTPGHKTAQIATILPVSPPPLPVTWTSDADRARARALLPDGTTWIGLGPTANWSGKVWPAANFAALFKQLQQGARPVIFAGPGAQERAGAQLVLDQLPDAVDLCGKLTLSEAAACLARCALFIGNDSGLMHISAASGVPTLGLFGPTSVAEYGPAGRAVAAVAGPGKDIASLTVAAALAAALPLLERDDRR